MKDQQEIQGVNSKFSLDRARLVRPGVSRSNGKKKRTERRQGDGDKTRKKRRTENNREARERERERVEKRREERENEERVENRKVRKEKGRADDVGLSQYLLSFFLTLGKEVSTFLHFMANGISSGRRWNSNVRISYPP